MTAFAHTVDTNGLVLRLETPSGFLGRTRTALPWSQWLEHAPANSRMALARLTDWSLDEQIQVDVDSVRIPHAIAATLTEVQAQSLSLPGAPPFAMHLEHDGTFDQPAFRFALTWRRNFQPVTAQRTGSILKVGQHSYRLSEPMYQLCEAVDAFNAAPPEQVEARFLVWARIQPYLDQRADVQASNYLQQTRIAHATRFSIHIDGAPGDPVIEPVLYGPASPDDPESPEPVEGAHEAEPLLPKRYQDTFARERFTANPEVRTRYALGDGWYAVLDDALKTALSEVRRVQGSSPEARRKFARNPQAWLREKLGDSLDEAALDSLFTVTDQYSERVAQMGIWEKPIVPWFKPTGNNWLPTELPETIPLQIAGHTLSLNPNEALSLLAGLRTAQEQGLVSIEFQGETFPVTPETVATVERACAEAAESKKTEPTSAKPDPAKNAEAGCSEEPLPASNLSEMAYEAAKRPRSTRLPPGLPDALQTMLKPHQETGLNWLQSAYVAGHPGVLLADDMGLGKTLQALSLLVWLSKAQLRSKPLMVVAPTGLLKNWEQEANLHFKGSALGAPYLAYGRNPVVAERLRDAAWVLTTYETIRNREQAFAGIAFGAVVFDEMQKIKSPDSHLTKCALTLNVDFVIGMTGTPVENRLADLWCLMDRTWPGLLPELKQFSNYYEKDASPERNRELKDKMLQGRGSEPPIMLRRMKYEHLPGLPNRKFESARVTMPAIQAQAYDKVLADARGREDRGWMLQALQQLRGVCLHPVHPDQSGHIGDDDYIAQSARLAASFGVLDEVHAKKRKALIFVELLAMQDKLAGLIQRRYRLRDLPMIISGDVSGAERQKRVDRFQADTGSFDVMILSPKAGGVGITLTAANHVIHLSRWWNPAVEDQCSDRIYRIGQTREVWVHCPLAIHPRLGDGSFDVKLDALLGRKRQMSQELLAPPTITDQDMKELWQQVDESRP